MSLKDRILRHIESLGPMSVADYMWTCLHDPAEGYYATRPSLGAEGDFITAPEVSQVFGEMIGVWAVETYRALGSPAGIRLVEVGGGTGRLMEDLLRTARLDPSLTPAMEIWMIEGSAPLRKLQEERLAGHPVRFASTLEEIGAGSPVLLVGNEVLDCLPARQFVKTQQGWRERVVGATGGHLGFGLAPCAETLVPASLRGAPEATVVEVSEPQRSFGAAVGRILSDFGGAALLIDYGRLSAEPGATLQALSRHRHEDPLERPGEADLTVHADFAAVASAAARPGLKALATTQGAFLEALGADLRFERLAALNPDRAPGLSRQRRRLMDPSEMGLLFKVLGLAPEHLDPAGFGGPQTRRLSGAGPAGDHPIEDLHDV